MCSNSTMPCWYFEKKELRNTPSLLDNIDYETESRYRKEGARFIIDTGTKMDLGYNTMATGVVYFHRFYMYHSFRNFPRYVTACCCLFLAGKVEETPKKCKDIIKAAKSFLTDQKFATFGDDPKEEVMTLERILLQTIKFDLQVEHPYQYLIKYAKCLKGDKAKLHKMVQMAWTFVNDSLCTTLCLQWEPEVIAVALMYLAGKLSKFEVLDWSGRNSKHLRWWDMFIEDVTMDLLEDICHQVLDLYSPPPANQPDSPPMPRSHNMKESIGGAEGTPAKQVQYNPKLDDLDDKTAGGQGLPSSLMEGIKPLKHEQKLSTNGDSKGMMMDTPTKGGPLGGLDPNYPYPGFSGPPPAPTLYPPTPYPPPPSNSSQYYPTPVPPRPPYYPPNP